MSCCGRQIQHSLSIPPSPARSNQASRPPLPQAAIRFEYVGTTGLTVVGPATGKRYRFDQTGSRLFIDPQDAPAIRAVPHLRRV